MVLQAALVAAQLFFHFFAAAIEGGIDLCRLGLGRGIETGGKMHGGLAGKFVTCWCANSSHLHVLRQLVLTPSLQQQLENVLSKGQLTNTMVGY